MLRRTYGRRYKTVSGDVRHGKGIPIMAHKTTRRGKRVLVIDFTYTKPDDAQGRYRRDAAVQTAAAAQTEDAARRMGATLFGNPDILCGANGQPLKPVDAAPPPLESTPPPPPASTPSIDPEMKPDAAPGEDEALSPADEDANQ